MSWMTVSSETFDQVKAEYKAARVTEFGTAVPEAVWVDLLNDNHSGRAHLSLSLENARTLAAALSQILMLHDAAMRLAAEKAVA